MAVGNVSGLEVVHQPVAVGIGVRSGHPPLVAGIEEVAVDTLDIVGNTAGTVGMD